MVRFSGWVACVLAVCALASASSISAAPGDTRHLAHVTPQQLRADCEAGFAFACVDLGVTYQVRGGVAARREAQRLYQLACSKGDPRGCEYLNVLIGVPPPSDHRVSRTFGRSTSKPSARVGPRDDARPHGAVSTVPPPVMSKTSPAGLVHPASVPMSAVSPLSSPMKAVAVAGGACRGVKCQPVVLAKARPLSTPAQSFLIQSCDGGSPTGCIALGAHFEEVGQIGAARDYYGRACRDGSALGCKSEGALGAYYAQPARPAKAGL